MTLALVIITLFIFTVCCVLLWALMRIAALSDKEMPHPPERDDGE